MAKFISLSATAAYFIASYRHRWISVCSCMLVDFFGIWFGFRVILFGIIIVMCEVLSLGNGNKFNKVFFSDVIIIVVVV